MMSFNYVESDRRRNSPTDSFLQRSRGAGVTAIKQTVNTDGSTTMTSTVTTTIIESRMRSTESDVIRTNSGACRLDYSIESDSVPPTIKFMEEVPEIHVRSPSAMDSSSWQSECSRECSRATDVSRSRVNYSVTSSSRNSITDLLSSGRSDPTTTSGRRFVNASKSSILLKKMFFLGGLLLVNVISALSSENFSISIGRQRILIPVGGVDALRAYQHYRHHQLIEVPADVSQTRNGIAGKFNHDSQMVVSSEDAQKEKLEVKESDIDGRRFSSISIPPVTGAENLDNFPVPPVFGDRTTVASSSLVESNVDSTVTRPATNLSNYSSINPPMNDGSPLMYGTPRMEYHNQNQIQYQTPMNLMNTPSPPKRSKGGLNLMENSPTGYVPPTKNQNIREEGLVNVVHRNIQEGLYSNSGNFGNENHIGDYHLAVARATNFAAVDKDVLARRLFPGRTLKAETKSVDLPVPQEQRAAAALLKGPIEWTENPIQLEKLGVASEYDDYGMIHESDDEDSILGVDEDESIVGPGDDLMMEHAHPDQSDDPTSRENIDCANFLNLWTEPQKQLLVGELKKQMNDNQRQLVTKTLLRERLDDQYYATAALLKEKLGGCGYQIQDHEDHQPVLNLVSRIFQRADEVALGESSGSPNESHNLIPEDDAGHHSRLVNVASQQSDGLNTVINMNTENNHGLRDCRHQFNFPQTPTTAQGLNMMARQKNSMIPTTPHHTVGDRLLTHPHTSMMPQHYMSNYDSSIDNNTAFPGMMQHGIVYDVPYSSTTNGFVNGFVHGGSNNYNHVQEVAPAVGSFAGGRLDSSQKLNEGPAIPDESGTSSNRIVPDYGSSSSSTVRKEGGASDSYNNEYSNPSLGTPSAPRMGDSSYGSEVGGYDNRPSIKFATETTQRRQESVTIIGERIITGGGRHRVVPPVVVAYDHTSIRQQHHHNLIVVHRQRSIIGDPLAPPREQDDTVGRNSADYEESQEILERQDNPDYAAEKHDEHHGVGVDHGVVLCRHDPSNVVSSCPIVHNDYVRPPQIAERNNFSRFNRVLFDTHGVNHEHNQNWRRDQMQEDVRDTRRNERSEATHVELSPPLNNNLMQAAEAIDSEHASSYRSYQKNYENIDDRDVSNNEATKRCEDSMNAQNAENHNAVPREESDDLYAGLFSSKKFKKVKLKKGTQERKLREERVSEEERDEVEEDSEDSEEDFVAIQKKMREAAAA